MILLRLVDQIKIYNHSERFNYKLYLEVVENERLLERGLKINISIQVAMCKKTKFKAYWLLFVKTFNKIQIKFHSALTHLIESWYWIFPW